MEIGELYERLNILDNKCSALLQLSSVILALNIIPAASGRLAGSGLVLSMSIGIMFLITSLLSLFVIWIKWDPTEVTLSHRARVYRVSVILTAIGLMCMTILIAVSLGVSG